MLLSVKHKTKYEYSNLVAGVVQSTRLTPSNYNGLKIISWDVQRSIGIDGLTYRDSAGNIINTYSSYDEISNIEFIVSGEVETFDTNGVFSSEVDKTNPYSYLRNTNLTEPDAEIRDLALSSQTVGDDEIETGHELLSNIADLVQYIPYTTNTFTTAAEALKQKKGVCQDQAHIMISSARFLGIPARYIYGYMHNNMNSSEFQSTHAWAELYFQNLGWVGFDPTNRCSPDERYIRVSSGLDANYAAPVKGIIYGTSTEKLEIKVETQQINSQQ